MWCLEIWREILKHLREVKVVASEEEIGGGGKGLLFIVIDLVVLPEASNFMHM